MGIAASGIAASTAHIIGTSSYRSMERCRKSEIKKSEMKLDVQVRIGPKDIYPLGMKMLHDEDARYACGDF